eukprot:11326319-Alexandrium_andersonii.AAC.1
MRPCFRGAPLKVEHLSDRPNNPPNSPSDLPPTRAEGWHSAFEVLRNCSQVELAVADFFECSFAHGFPEAEDPKEQLMRSALNKGVFDLRGDLGRRWCKAKSGCPVGHGLRG